MNKVKLNYFPESKTQFFYSDEKERKIEFELDKSNAIIIFWVIDSGLKHELN